MTIRAPFRNLFFAWLALMLLLATTIAGAYVPLGDYNIVLALGIALAKAAIVIVIFMELGRGPSLAWIFAGAGFFWLMIMLGLTSLDYITRVVSRVTALY